MFTYPVRERLAESGLGLLDEPLGRDWRRLERFAEVREHFPDRHKPCDDCNESDVAAVTTGLGT